MKPVIHRYINTVLLLITIVLGIVLVVELGHDLEDCEAKLYHKITNMDAPTKADLCGD